MGPFSRAIILVVAALTAAGAGVRAEAAARPGEGANYFRIGTGSIAGTYFPVGEALAAILSQPAGAPPCDEGGRCGVPGLITTAQATEGSLANIAAVNSGELEAGLAQASVVDAAYRGARLFDRKSKAANLRVIANLYPESVHLVVARGARVRDLPDLKGRRLSMDKSLSGTAADTSLVLKAYGLARADFTLVEDSPVRAADLLAQGRIDGFFFISGYPAPLIADLADRAEIDLIPIAGPPARKLIKDNPFYTSGVIPSGTYRGIGATDTVQVGAQLIVGAQVPDDLVYAIVRKLWDPANRQALIRRHPKAEAIRLDTALAGVTIPLHPGAARYYREAGLIP